MAVNPAPNDIKFNVPVKYEPAVGVFALLFSAPIRKGSVCAAEALELFVLTELPFLYMLDCNVLTFETTQSAAEFVLLAPVDPDCTKVDEA